VYDLEDEKKELPPKDRPVVGFYHTHPGFTATPSFIDHGTMGAWVNCLGKPLWCVIKGVDGIRAFLYKDDESYPSESAKCVQIDGILIIDTINLKDYGDKEENDDAEKEVDGRPEEPDAEFMRELKSLPDEDPEPKDDWPEIDPEKLAFIKKIMASPEFQEDLAKTIEEADKFCKQLANSRKVDPAILNIPVMADGLPPIVPIGRSWEVVEAGIDELNCPRGHGEVCRGTGRCKVCGWSAISLMDD